jgi:U2 small nuclear ribonucleoprotein A'
LGKTALRILDYKRIKDVERSEAKALFEDSETGLPNKLALSLTTEAATNAANAAAANAVVGQSKPNGTSSKGKTLTEDEKNRIREAIKGATSIEEIKRLDRMLAEGSLPEAQAV